MKQGILYELKKNKALFAMLIPFTLMIIVFNYLPMSGLIIAFKNYRFDLGVFGSHWHGLENFRYLFSSGTGWNITKNTVLYNLLNLVTSQGLAIVAAILISELTNRVFKRLTQSVIFLPYFISWVIVGTFVFNIFNYETGLMNNLLAKLGMEKVNIYAMPGIWPVIICVFNAWKWVGYNSIIYIASISGVDAECYEAADIDGANIFQRIWHITLPAIRPTVITMILLQVGRILRGDFEMFYQIVGNNGQLYDATDVIDTYVFRLLITNSDVGVSAAAGLYQSILCFITITICNRLVKKVQPDYALY